MLTCTRTQYLCLSPCNKVSHRFASFLCCTGGQPTVMVVCWSLLGIKRVTGLMLMLQMEHGHKLLVSMIFSSLIRDTGNMIFLPLCIVCCWIANVGCIILSSIIRNSSCAASAYVVKNALVDSQGRELRIYPFVEVLCQLNFTYFWFWGVTVEVTKHLFLLIP